MGKDKIDEWSENTYRHENQAKHHNGQVREFLEWAKKTPDQVLKEGWDGLKDRSAARLILNYKGYLDKLREKDPENAPSEITIFDGINAIRSFYKYWGLQITLRKNEAEVPASVNIDHRFSLAEIAGMVHRATSLRNKAIILVASSTGLREGDVAALPRKRIESLLSQEAPISIGPITTMKKRVIAYPFLHKSAVEMLKKYLATRTDKVDLLFPTDQGKRCIGKYLDRVVKNSFTNAGFEAPATERVRFHALRKFTIGRFQDGGIEENVWKTMIGKKSKEAAYTTEQLREHFVKVQDRLDPEAVTNNHAKMEDLSTKVENLEKENAILKQQLIELANKKGFEVLMELYGDRQKAINKEAFDKAVPAAASLNGHKPVSIEPVTINGAEILTLKSLAQALQGFYAEQQKKTTKEKKATKP